MCGHIYVTNSQSKQTLYITTDAKSCWKKNLEYESVL